jgi:hypothetical protein
VTLDLELWEKMGHQMLLISRRIPLASAVAIRKKQRQAIWSEQILDLSPTGLRVISILFINEYCTRDCICLCLSLRNTCKLVSKKTSNTNMHKQAGFREINASKSWKCWWGCLYQQCLNSDLESFLQTHDLCHKEITSQKGDKRI